MSPNELHFLLTTPYFRRCELQDVSVFFSNLQVKQFLAGEQIFKQGEIESGWYLVRRGQVKLTRKSYSGMQHTLAELSEGEAFGEMGLLEKVPRLATAMAVTPVSVYVLSGDAFAQLLDNKDPVAYRMLQAMAITQSQRLREMTLTLQDLTELDALGDYAPAGNPLDFSSLLSASFLRN